MNEKTLIDTNVLINAYFLINNKNHDKAIKILDKYANTPNGYVTIQNITEFINISKNKLKINNKELKVYINEIKTLFNIITPTENSIETAFNLSLTYKISFLDALLAQTIIDNNVHSIYSDNLNIKKVKKIKFKLYNK